MNSYGRGVLALAGLLVSVSRCPSHSQRTYRRLIQKL